MCEANAYIQKDDSEELLMESVDLLEPTENGEYRLVNIFGEQKTIKATIKSMSLVNHRIVFEAQDDQN